MKKTVIFDMDGVLVDSEPFNCKAWIETYKEIGIHLTEEYYFSRICGQHGIVSTTMVLNEHGREEDKEHLVRRKAQHTVKLVKNNIQAVNGAVSCIQDLRKLKYKLGLATTTSFVGADAILSTIGVKNDFSVIHTSEAVKKGKPNPEVYLKTASMLEVKPENCVVIEDSKSGSLAAKKAGMKVIGILNGRNNPEELQYVDYIVKSFSEISPELIESL